MDGWLDSPNSGICMHVFQNTLISFVRLYGNSSECQSVSLAAEEQLLSTIKVLVATSCWQILNQINLSIIIVWMDDWTLQTQVYARIRIRMSLYSLLLDYGNASECRKWDLLCYKRKFISTLAEIEEHHIHKLSWVGNYCCLILVIHKTSFCHIVCIVMIAHKWYDPWQLRHLNFWIMSCESLWGTRNHSCVCISLIQT